MTVGGRGKNFIAALLFGVLSCLLLSSSAWGEEEKVFYSGKNYIFSGNWTRQEVEAIAKLQNKAKDMLEQCQGYITPEEQKYILAAYNIPVILHIKNNALGENIGASVASQRRSPDNATPLAMDLASYSYSAMQINVKELFKRGEKEVIKTLLHEMAHTAAPHYTHPAVDEIWDISTGKLKPGRDSSEYNETVPVRVENCVRDSNLSQARY